MPCSTSPDTLLLREKERIAEKLIFFGHSGLCLVAETANQKPHSDYRDFPPFNILCHEISNLRQRGAKQGLKGPTL